MKRSIAMRCTQEQFDGINEQLKDRLYVVFDFEKYPYLCSNYFHNTSLYLVGNNFSKSLYPEVYEQWDENIFLEACGIKLEEIEYQWFNGRKWIDCSDKIRIKPKYDKEIEQIKILAKEIGYNVNLEPIK